MARTTRPRARLTATPCRATTEKDEAEEQAAFKAGEEEKDEVEQRAAVDAGEDLQNALTPK